MLSLGAKKIGGITPQVNKHRQPRVKTNMDDRSGSSLSISSGLPIDENNNLSNQTLENVLPQHQAGSTNDPNPFQLIRKHSMLNKQKSKFFAAGSGSTPSNTNPFMRQGPESSKHVSSASIVTVENNYTQLTRPNVNHIRVGERQASSNN